MSLEIALAENTAAIRELIAKLTAGAAIPQDAAQTVSPSKPTDKKAKSDPKPDAAQSSDATPTVSDNSKSSTSESEPGEPSAATYEDAKNAVLRISKANGRDAAVEVLQRFGATKLPDVLPRNYGDLVALVNETLGTE